VLSLDWACWYLHTKVRLHNPPYPPPVLEFAPEIVLTGVNFPIKFVRFSRSAVHWHDDGRTKHGDGALPRIARTRTLPLTPAPTPTMATPARWWTRPTIAQTLTPATEAGAWALALSAPARTDIGSSSDSTSSDSDSNDSGRMVGSSSDSSDFGDSGRMGSSSDSLDSDSASDDNDNLRRRSYCMENVFVRVACYLGVVARGRNVSKVLLHINTRPLKNGAPLTFMTNSSSLGLCGIASSPHRVGVSLSEHTSSIQCPDGGFLSQHHDPCFLPLFRISRRTDRTFTPPPCYDHRTYASPGCHERTHSVISWIVPAGTEVGWAVGMIGLVL